MIEWLCALCKKRARARAAKARSEAIDLEIAESKKIQKVRRTILVAGVLPQKLWRNIQMFTLGFSDADRSRFRCLILHYLLNHLVMCMERSRDNCTEEEQAFRETEKTLRQHSGFGLNRQDCSLPSEAVNALQYCAWDLANSSLRKHIDEAALLFLHDLDRIVKPGHLTSDEDIMNLPAQWYGRSQGPIACEFLMGHLKITASDLGGASSERRKWIHYIEETHCVMVSVDLTGYDHLWQFSRDDQMVFQEELVHFDSMVNSRWLTRSTFVLVMTNHKLLESKLKSSRSGGGPIHDIPDGGPKEFVEYTFKRFCKRSRSSGEIHAFICELDAPSSRQALRFAVDTILEKEIRPVPCFGGLAAPVIPGPHNIIYEKL